MPPKSPMMKPQLLGLEGEGTWKTSAASKKMMGPKPIDKKWSWLWGPVINGLICYMGLIMGLI